MIVYYRFSGLKAASYHATNVALHGLATGLVLVVARTVTCDRGALLSAALFAVHPVHADAVASVVGRADVLSCVFFLLSFLCYGRHVRTRDGGPRHHRCATDRLRHRQHQSHHHHSAKTDNTTHAAAERVVQTTGRSATVSVSVSSAYLAFCVLFAALSTLSKENGITVLAVCIGCELLHRFMSTDKVRKTSFQINFFKGEANVTFGETLEGLKILFRHLGPLNYNCENHSKISNFRRSLNVFVRLRDVSITGSATFHEIRTNQHYTTHLPI